jgi:hypothetical protein
MACVFVFATYYRINAASLGGGLGTSTGSLAGKAIGSLEGMTVGMAKGTEAGKAEGLSAEDTKAEIVNQIQQVGELEVLVASVKLSNFHTIGDSIDYAALYLVNGNVVFTVDFAQAKIVAENDTLHITFSKPKGNLYLDESSVEKVAEYQRRFFNGSAEDGFDAYLNTMTKVQEATEDTLDNYDSLIVAAKESAANQVTLLAQSVSTTYNRVVVEFADRKVGVAHE